jgi:outer membrane receptor for ferrienterochelin and colicins
MTRFDRSPAKWLPITGCIAVCLALPAAAQNIDYTTLEQIFHEPVTISATGKPQRASDVPADMVIVTQDDIRRSGAQNIPEALQFIPGVDVRRYGLADYEVGIRGYNQPYNARLLVLVNGRTVYSDDYGHVNWASIPVQLSEIRQIEVIKGPNSALYGFNAASGVINIITYDPMHDKVNTATLGGGTLNYLGGSAVGTAQVGDRAGLRISAGGFHASDFTPGGLSALDVASRQNPLVGAFNIDGRIRIAPGVEAFLEASMSDSSVAEKDFAGAFDTNSTRANSLRAGISADTAIGLLSFDAYRNGQVVTIGSPSLNGLANWVNESVTVVQASDLVKLGADQTVRLGLEYRNDEATAPGFAQGSVGYDVYAASLMWNWQIAPNLSLTNAVRVDDLRLHYSGTLAAGTGFTQADYDHAGFAVPTFNSGIVFNVTPQDTLRLTVARGVQLPSLVDFGLQIPFGTFGSEVIAGNPDLHPSTVDNIEVDYDRDLPAIVSSFRAAIFAQRNLDLISQPFAVPPVIEPSGVPALLAGNVGSSDAAGVELGLKGHSQSGLRWQLNYAFAYTTNDTVLNKAGLLTSTIDYAHSVPRHVVTAGIGYTRDRLEMDLLGRWQSSYLDFQDLAGSVQLQPIEVQNYVTLNARVGYRLTDHLTAAVTAQQFNQSRIMQAAGPQVEREIIASVTVRY